MIKKKKKQSNLRNLLQQEKKETGPKITQYKGKKIANTDIVTAKKVYGFNMIPTN